MKKRAKQGRNRNGTGSFETLPSGLVRFVKMQDGKRLKGPAAETRAEAESAWARKFTAEPSVKLEAKPLHAYVYELVNRSTGELLTEQSPTTLSLYRSIYNRYIVGNPDANIPMDSWTVPMARAWVKSLNVAPVTAERYIAAMRGIFRRAKQDGLCRDNPFEFVKAPPRPAESEKTVLPRHEQKELLSILDGRTRDAAVLWLHGLRRGEAAGLRFEDFDGEGVQIRRVVCETDSGLTIKPFPKNRRARWVPLDAEGIELMSRQTSGWVLPCLKRRKTDGKYAADTQKILKEFGGMCSRPHNLYRGLVQRIAGTKFEGTHPHDYRSSAGTDFIRLTDLRTAAEIMGHDPKVLAEHYARSDRKTKKAAVKRRN